MAEDRKRRRWKAGEVTVTATVEGERRTVIVVGPGRHVVIDSSTMLTAGDLDRDIRRDVPGTILEDVLAWLAEPADEEST